MSKLLTAVVIVTTAAAGLVPFVAMAMGRKDGPCTATVTCVTGGSVSCAGDSVCYYKVDSLSSRGFVQCDSDPALYCGFPIE